MKKTLLLAGVACTLLVSQANAANWATNYVDNMTKDAKIYVGADYAFDDFDFKGSLDGAKTSYNSAALNIGAKMGMVGVEFFGQWSFGRTKDTDDGKIKTRVNAYGMDLYGYMPLGCEGKYELLGSVGVADYYYKGLTEDSNDTNNHIGWRVGGGAMYNITDHVSARVMGRYAYIGASELNHAAEVTAGLRYNF